MSVHLEKAYEFCEYIKNTFGLTVAVDTSLEHTKEYCAKDGFFLIDIGERTGAFSTVENKLRRYSEVYRKFDVVSHGVERVAILNYKQQLSSVTK